MVIWIPATTQTGFASDFWTNIISSTNAQFYMYMYHLQTVLRRKYLTSNNNSNIKPVVSCYTSKVKKVKSPPTTRYDHFSNNSDGTFSRKIEEMIRKESTSLCLHILSRCANTGYEPRKQTSSEMNLRRAITNVKWMWMSLKKIIRKT